MKLSQKDSEKLIWDQLRSSSSPQSRNLLVKLVFCFILFISATYLVYTLRLIAKPLSCDVVVSDSDPFSDHHFSSSVKTTEEKENPNSVGNVKLLEVGPEKSEPTNISHIVFGIGASAKLWNKRKNYIKIWYNSSQMRGVVWVDKAVKTSAADGLRLPEIRISGDTSDFAYTHKKGHRSAIRISRIVSETLKLGFKNVRWFVMGDDDTFFVTENLVRVLQKYDHNQFYYIGSNSESHTQNIYFSYGMAYGGGGFAISYPLAVALETMQDRCIQRYPGLYGSDDRMQACMAELGVPLTKENGFHQYDVHGNLFGLLAAHPLTPLVSLHHLDVVEPIFPNVTRVQALRRLTVLMKLDSGALMQQSICYEKNKTWTVSVSWGFAIQVVRGILSPREMEMPTRTFLNWYKRGDYTAYAFNTRPQARNPCQKPFVYYFSEARFDDQANLTVSEYLWHNESHPPCRWKMDEPSAIERVIVYKKPDPQLWARSPRRNCCRILNSDKNGTMEIDVGVCTAGEVIEV